MSNIKIKNTKIKKSGYVIAKCMKCKERKKYYMDEPLNHTPMCTHCFMSPMVVVKIVYG
jgi:formylmethanofuran dehydrogenase subunit E